jgi:hypothetical protein
MTTIHEKDLAGVRELMADDIRIELPFNESGKTEDGYYRVHRSQDECCDFWATGPTAVPTRTAT